MEKHMHIPFISPLREYVTSIWEVIGNRNINETILPKGVVEIIFNFAGAINGFLPYSRIAVQMPRCFIQGVNTHITNASYLGQHHLLGIHLHPHNVKALLGILPSELNNRSIDLALIKPQFNSLWHQLVEVNSFEERIKLLYKTLPVITQTACQRSQRLSGFFLFDGLEGHATVDELARQVCYSTRQLNRVTHTLFGLSAEELISYKRYMQAVKYIHAENSSLTNIAYSCGFYDQSHFCRIFKTYSGITAKQYKDLKSDLPFHIFS